MKFTIKFVLCMAILVALAWTSGYDFDNRNTVVAIYFTGITALSLIFASIPNIEEINL